MLYKTFIVMYYICDNSNLSQVIHYSKPNSFQYRVNHNDRALPPLTDGITIHDWLFNFFIYC